MKKSPKKSFTNIRNNNNIGLNYSPIFDLVLREKSTVPLSSILFEKGLVNRHNFFMTNDFWTWFKFVRDLNYINPKGIPLLNIDCGILAD